MMPCQPQHDAPDQKVPQVGICCTASAVGDPCCPGKAYAVVLLENAIRDWIVFAALTGVKVMLVG
jgi:hypothetical protein